MFRGVKKRRPTVRSEQSLSKDGLQFMGERRSEWLLPLAIVCSLAIVIFSFQLRQRSQVLAVSVENNRRIRSNVSDLLSAMGDAETGQRGYLLTGQEEYLEPFHAGRVRAADRLNSLLEDTRSDAEQSARVKAMQRLTGEKLRELNLTITLARNSRREEALLLVKTNAGKRIMDEIRVLCAQMKSSENARLGENAREADRFGRVAFVVTTTGSGFLVVLLALARMVIGSANRQRERFLARLRDQAMILDLANDAIFIRDSEDRVTYWNQGAQRMYGWSKEEAIGRVTHTLLKTQFPQPLKEISATLFSEGHWKGELIHTGRDGTLINAASAWTLQRNDWNHLHSILEMNYDITERKRAEAALREVSRLLEERVAELAETNTELTKKNEEVEAFVYIVSHDLRAPLVNLQGFCRELELSCEELGQKLGGDEARVQTILTADIPDSLRYINASTTKFHRLINALLELSRYGRQQYHPEELDLGAVVQSTLDLMHLSIGVSGLDIAVGVLPKAFADATAIGQVFSNLIGNSVKYLKPGRPGHIEIGGEREGREAHCWVRDNGAGLPASAKTRLFQVFQRFHPDLAPGEGMGLAIVRRVVERHGGRIWAEGEEGVGSTFHFTLPCGAPH
jgi:PAS domain S-box-containing protein